MGTGNLQSARTWDKFRQNSGGASRDRTDDLLHAMQALSQLSYSPSVQVSLSCGTGPKKRGAKLREHRGSVKQASDAHSGQRLGESQQGALAPQQRQRDIDCG